MSRPARAGSAGKPVTIRATDAERERWTATAIRERLDLSTWLRELANGRASRAEKAAPPGAWSAALALARGNSLENTAKSGRIPRRKP